MLLVCIVELLLVSLAATASAGAVVSGGNYGDAVHTWDSYVKSLPSNIQDRCMPQRFPYQGDTFKGVVVMLHGFSACPNQYPELARLVAAEGYEVLTPLLPGHGRSRDSKGLDDIPAQTFLAQDYRDFSVKITGMVKKYPAGSHRVAGISVGAVVAAFMGQLTEADKTTAVYQRQLIMNPMFSLPDLNCGNPLNRLLTGVQNSALRGNLAMKALFHEVKDYQSGWGEGCEVEYQHGRGGFCNFTIGSSHAAFDVGMTTLQQVEERPQKRAGLQKTVVQVVYTERDLVSNVGGTRKYYEAMKADSDTSASMCALYTPLGHSFVSPYDTPMDNKYWLNEMLCRLTEYLTAKDDDLDSFIAHAPDGTTLDHKDPYCRTVCTAKTCPWTQAKNVHFPPADANKLCPKYVPNWVPAHV